MSLLITCLMLGLGSVIGGAVYAGLRQAQAQTEAELRDAFATLQRVADLEPSGRYAARGELAGHLVTLTSDLLALQTGEQPVSWQTTTEGISLGTRVAFVFDFAAASQPRSNHQRLNTAAGDILIPSDDAPYAHALTDDDAFNEALQAVAQLDGGAASLDENGTLVVRCARNLNAASEALALWRVTETLLTALLAIEPPKLARHPNDTDLTTGSASGLPIAF